MRRVTQYLGLALMLFAVWIVAPAEVFAISPQDQVKETIDRVLEILQDQAAAGGSDRADRKEELREILSRRFDFKEMARVSLGDHWNRQAEKQQEFISAFSEFLENSYVKKIESLKNTTIVYIREHVDRGLAQVDTKIVPSRGGEMPIFYKLRFAGGEWKIYDVLVENISLVENYRSQFNRILASATFDDLIKKLQQKAPAKGG